MAEDVLIDVVAGCQLHLLAGVIEQEADLGGLIVDAVDGPRVEDGHVVEKALLRAVVDAGRVGFVDALGVAGHFGGIGPGQERRPVHLSRLAGEDVVVPGMRRRLQEFGETILSIPERLIEQGGEGPFWPQANAAHVAVTGLPHHLQNGRMAAEAVGVAAGRGEAVDCAAEGVLDQFFGVAQFISERGSVLAQLFQVGMGEGVALDVEEGMVENGAQFRAAELQHFGDEKEGCGRVALQVGVGDGAHAVEKLGDMFGRVAEASLTPVLIPPRVDALGVVGGDIVGHGVPPFRLRREREKSIIRQLLRCAQDSTKLRSAVWDAFTRHQGYRFACGLHLWHIYPGLELGQSA